MPCKQTEKTNTKGTINMRQPHSKENEKAIKSQKDEKSL